MPQAQPTAQPVVAAGRPVWLTCWERRGLVLLLALTVLFGCLVEFRSAFLTHRMGDLERLHADGLGRACRRGHLRRHRHHKVSIITILPCLPSCWCRWRIPAVGRAVDAALPGDGRLCYVLSVLCLALAVHWLAGALEQTSPDPAVRTQPRGCRRWWALRVLPVLACLPPIGHTLMRGQVNLLLLLLLAGMAAALLCGRRRQTGWWLAGAISLKVIPVFLLLVPVYRRDVRCLAGCVGGLILGLAVIPAAVFGPSRTLAYYREWTEVVVRPAFAEGQDTSRAKELIEATATDSQSLQVILHNTLNWDRWTRPTRPRRRFAGPPCL